jgi:hypothetical protein
VGRGQGDSEHTLISDCKLIIVLRNICTEELLCCGFCATASEYWRDGTLHLVVQSVRWLRGLCYAIAKAIVIGSRRRL